MAAFGGYSHDRIPVEFLGVEYQAVHIEDDSAEFAGQFQGRRHKSACR
jgi:hypothetical protein